MAVNPVNTNERREQYVSSGSTGPYSFNFVIYNQTGTGWPSCLPSFWVVFPESPHADPLVRNRLPGSLLWSSQSPRKEGD